MIDTVQTEALAEPEAPPQAEPVPIPPPRAVRQRPAMAGAATGMGMLAALVAGALVYLFALAPMAENSRQQVQYEAFAADLAAAVAPVDAAVDHGKPVAILQIPQMGLDDEVVVSGTTGADLTHGPGLRRDTVLPGQPGVSVIYGRSATFGAPFGKLGDLRRGDRFAVVTGQGTATYVVDSFGTGKKPPAATTSNRLVLTTAAQDVSDTVSVSANLVSAPQPAPGGSRPAITKAERGLGIDTGVLVTLLLWSQALVLVTIAAVLAGRRWQRMPTFVCLAPIALAVLWNVYENAACLLPNLY